MGEVKLDEIDNIKLSCAKRLCSYVHIINITNEQELLHFLVIIVQYVYAKLYTYGKQQSNKYYVYTKDVEHVFSTANFPGYFTRIVNLRNAMCHEYGTLAMYRCLEQFNEIKHRLNDFLFYVLSDEECLHNHIIQEYCNKHNIVDKAQFEEEMNRLAKLCGSTDKKNVAFFIKDNLL